MGEVKTGRCLQVVRQQPGTAEGTPDTQVAEVGTRGRAQGWQGRAMKPRRGLGGHSVWFPVSSVLGGRVPQRGPRGRPAAARAALPLWLPLLQQWHRAALPGPHAALHQDVPGLPR